MLGSINNSYTYCYAKARVELISMAQRNEGTEYVVTEVLYQLTKL